MPLSDVTKSEVTESNGSGHDAAIPSSGPKAGVTGDLFNVLRGFLMGAADTVPGVSGGTVALILGHYRRLVTAISHVDARLVTLIRERRFHAAANHLDLRFLVSLGLGIAIGIVSLAGLMHWLLDHRMPETLAIFLGLVLASVWIVRRYVDHWGSSRLIALAIGIVVAVVICVLPMSHGSMSLPFLFVSASIAICAMILPGISGAFVLLLLGVYHPVTGLVKEAAKGHITMESATQIIVFASGCAFGLIAFSRVLRWLLEHYSGVTMAGLVGLMIGSVGRLWPLQSPTPETAELAMKFREMQYFSPTNWEGTSIVILVSLAIMAGFAVIVIEHVGDAKS